MARSCTTIYYIDVAGAHPSNGDQYSVTNSFFFWWQDGNVTTVERHKHCRSKPDTGTGSPTNSRMKPLANRIPGITPIGMRLLVFDRAQHYHHQSDDVRVEWQPILISQRDRITLVLGILHAISKTISETTAAISFSRFFAPLACLAVIF